MKKKWLCCGLLCVSYIAVASQVPVIHITAATKAKIMGKRGTMQASPERYQQLYDEIAAEQKTGLKKTAQENQKADQTKSAAARNNEKTVSPDENSAPKAAPSQSTAAKSAKKQSKKKPRKRPHKPEPTPPPKSKSNKHAHSVVHYKSSKTPHKVAIKKHKHKLASKQKAHQASKHKATKHKALKHAAHKKHHTSISQKTHAKKALHHTKRQHVTKHKHAAHKNHRTKKAK